MTHPMRARNEEIVRLYQAGIEGPAIAERFSVTRARVYQILDLYGIARRPRDPRQNYSKWRARTAELQERRA